MEVAELISDIHSFTHIMVLQIGNGDGYVFMCASSKLFPVDILYGLSSLDLNQWNYNVVEDFSTSEPK